MSLGTERKTGITVDINNNPSGVVTLTTTETRPIWGLRERIAAMRGQEPSLLFRETIETTEYTSIESLKKAVSRKEILRTGQMVVGLTGVFVGLLFIAVGIDNIAAGGAYDLSSIAGGIGGISIITGFNFGLTGAKEYLNLRSINYKVRTLFPN